MDTNEIKQEFRKRKIRQILLIIPFVVIVFLIVLNSNSENQLLEGMSNEHLLLTNFVYVVLGFIFTLINWRCPHCKRFPGKDINPKFCAMCGAELR